MKVFDIIIMVITVVSFTLTILGTGLTVYGVIITRKANRKAKTIDWNQVMIATKSIVKKLKSNNFIPDVIVTPGQKGGIFAQLIMDSLNVEIPIVTGFFIPNKPSILRSYSDQLEYYYNHNFFKLETSKWFICLPDTVLGFENKKILIVDDLVMSGDALRSILNKIKDTSSTNSIKSCSLVTTKVAIQTKKNPDYYWNIIDADDCYFPWGKAR